MSNENALIINSKAIKELADVCVFETEQQEKSFKADVQYHFNSVIQYFHAVLSGALSLAGANTIINSFVYPNDITPDEVLTRGELLYIPYPVAVAENVDLSGEAEDEASEDYIPRTLEEVIVDDCNYLKATYLPTTTDGEFYHAQKEEFEEGVVPTYTHVVYYGIPKEYMAYHTNAEEAPRWMATANADIEVVDAKTDKPIKPTEPSQPTAPVKTETKVSESIVVASNVAGANPTQENEQGKQSSETPAPVNAETKTTVDESSTKQNKNVKK